MDANEVLALPVRRAMRDVLTVVGPDTSIAATVRLFAERHISGAPVVAGDGTPVGVVSRRDLLEAQRKDLGQAGTSHYYLMLRGEMHLDGGFPDLATDGVGGIVADVMSPEIVSVESGVPIRVAVERLLAAGVHRLLVVDGTRLVGILSSSDVLRMLVPTPEVADEQGF